MDKHRGKPDRIYSYNYRDAAGKLRWVTVGKASHGITEEYAHRKRIEAVNQVNLGENPDRRKKSITLTAAFEDYVKAQAADGKHTNKEVNRFNSRIKPRFGDTPLLGITEKELTEFKAVLLKELSPQSVKHVFALIRRVINHSIRRGRFKGHNPISGVTGFRMPTVRNEAERFLMPDEAVALLDELAKRSQQLHDMALLSLRTGLRATEIFRLTGGSLDAENGLLHFSEKGGNRAAVHVDEETISMLQEYRRKPGELFFPRRDGTRQHEIPGTFERAVDTLGLNEGVKDTRYQVRFHTLRHTWASWLAQSGQVTLFELKELGRWKRIETVMRYSHLIPNASRDKLSIIKQNLVQAQSQLSQHDETP